MPSPAATALDAPVAADDRRRCRSRRRASPAVAALLVIAIVLTAVATACLFDDSEEEFLAYCTDRNGWDYSNSDCACYWEEMRDDDIAPQDIVGLIRGDEGVDLRASLSERRASDRCFR